jgi:hypothetical protein
MAILGILAVIFLMAFMVESLVEYLFGQAVSHLPILQPYAWLLMYAAAIVGVIGAFLYGFDLLYLLGNYLGVPVDAYPIMASPTWFGTLLTGLAIGRGSNYLHDLVAKFFVKPSSSGAVG